MGALSVRKYEYKLIVNEGGGRVKTRTGSEAEKNDFCEKIFFALAPAILQSWEPTVLITEQFSLSYISDQ